MRTITVFAVIVLTLPSLAHASLTRDRARYQRALVDLTEGRYQQFNTLYNQERGYILRPYLRYHELMRRLRHTKPAAIQDFLTKHGDLPIAFKLRVAWLRFLAHHKRYKVFLSFYNPSLDVDTSLYCDELHAQALAGQSIMPSFQALWLSGTALPKSCHALTSAFQSQGLETPALAWSRVKLAMHVQNVSLVTKLVPALTAKKQVWARRWLAMQNDPLRALRHIDYPLAKRGRHIVRSGIMVLAGEDPVLAMTLWDQLLVQYPPLQSDKAYVLRHVALIAAYDHLPQALPWMEEITASPTNETLQKWRVRAALRERAWPQVLTFISDMPASMRQHKEWRYWRARALLKTGDKSAGLKLLRALARHLSYYGFLAADRLGVPYNMTNKRLAVSWSAVARLTRRPGIRMARELFVLHHHREAWRQWLSALAGASREQMHAAALLAARWGWHGAAVLTVAGTGAQHALAIRFPLAYRSLVLADAHADGIDPAWVYGVIRQESAFMVDARSCVGALGLMQLMPQTGFVAARELHLPIDQDRDLINVANNVDVGARYLADVLNRETGQEPIATAAYNAGPAAVAQWMPVRKALPADIWVDTIPYQQTRRYVKDVMAFTAVYDYLLTGKMDALRSRMAPVPPTVELVANENQSQ